ncbi:DUF2497 domain-containing protein [Hyphococcus flavus]|uniref:DUF2497 domain-containing protein n=1 Tax=Hyphococcus flavus TaxID=1866326 RepID=A0AAE9ZGS5_9PROT|nr:DUF2497 domain-containing protein [Hyphococcus flavus]WDI30561.1 DUF2497 domain-containing protein [Hyphococcus flavus]
MENAQPEPSMEEILASIRRIISEDDEDQGSTTSNTPSAQPVAEHKPEEPATPFTPQSSQEAAPDAPSETAQSDDEAETRNQTVAAVMENDTEEDILDRTTAEVASRAFHNLSQSVRVSEGPGKTLEDIVTEMLRPMVKDWLDANLPAIVEEKVEEEVQRVARRRR